MKHGRKLVLGCAGISWGGALMLAVNSAAGFMEDMRWWGVFLFLLGVAITLTLGALITRYVMDPRRAYQLGWEARRRLDASHTESMESRATSQRRA